MVGDFGCEARDGGLELGARGWGDEWETEEVRYWGSRRHFQSRGGRRTSVEAR